ncbi:hypothetical protein GCM10011412_19270 [Maribacter cobaltidurans]|nr:hypothetical protein [Maribacter cobaltidurans]GGD81638.1 hypothetical protein GCM10011412_19270 [Maribacter cobaltidurans]
MESTITYDIDFIDKLMSQPSQAASHMDLTYVNRDTLSILRLRKGEEFVYQLHEKPLRKKGDLERIKKLVIPPAWKDVRIATQSNAHLQAIGYDVKKRTQYRYHPTWLIVRNRAKFYKMLHFGESLPIIRDRIEKDLRLEGGQKNKVLALILSLMEETHIRIGNQQYAKRNNTYGLSTLRSKHVTLFKDNVKFEFTGKKAKSTA